MDRSLGGNRVAELTEWVRKARDGDVEAYAKIFRRFQDMAVGYAFSLLGDFHEAEDAAQDAFVAAFRHLPQLRDPRAFAGWFRRVVRTHADRVRRRRLTVPLEETSPAGRAADDPAAMAERVEDRDRVIAAVRALPRSEREVITLVCINGYSSPQIGQFLEVPASTVRSRLQSARRRLRQEVMDMVKDRMEPHRPSRDKTLARRVQEVLEAAGHGSADDFEAALSGESGLAAASGKHPYGWGYDVNALHMAAQWGQNEKVSMLLDRGVDIDGPDGKGCTPVQIAILYRFPETARLLAERGATVDVWTAAALGDVTRLETMLADQPEIARTTDAFAHGTPLHWAGTVAVARFLIERGSDAGAKDADGNTPARWAAGYCAVRPGVAEFLAGLTGEGDIFMACALGQADRVARYLDGDPGLVGAVIGPRDAISTLYFYPYFTPLHTAVFHRKEKVVRLLLDRGADVNARPPGGRGLMPLHTAAAFGDVAAARVLHEAGAELDAEDDLYHGTARAHAQFWRQPELMDFLARQGGKSEVPRSTNCPSHPGGDRG